MIINILSVGFCFNVVYLDYMKLFIYINIQMWVLLIYECFIYIYVYIHVC